MYFTMIIPSFNNIFESGINKKLFTQVFIEYRKRCFYIIETGERVLKKRITFAFC